MIILEEHQPVNHALALHPIAKASNELLLTHNCTDTPEFRSPLFDISKWNLENNLMHERSCQHSKNSTRLFQALDLFGNSHLYKCTLLDPQTHKKHAQNLYRRFIRLFAKNLITPNFNKKKFVKFGDPLNGYFEEPDHHKARDFISFITVIHAVEAINVDAALVKAQKLKNEIYKYVSMMPGAACVGAIEVEVTSIKLQRRIRDLNQANARKDISNIDEDGVISCKDDSNNYIKLIACETLSSHLSDEQINGESGQFIIHFHGILKVEKLENTNELRKIFITNPNWNKANKQVQFKPFSECRGGKLKTLENSLRDIANYITKGGAVRQGNIFYLQYKIKMPDDLKMSYEDYLILSDRNNKPKIQEQIENGDIFDLPVLSHHEINSLTLVVDGMMNWNKSRTGYVVSVGKW